jgi:hypothetical protein
MSHIDEIVKSAKTYIGQEEIPPNAGFKDPLFAKKMNDVGFYKGASWCGFFVMMVLFDVYKDSPEVLKYLKKYCSASTHQMWLNFKASKEVKTSMIPKLGSVVIWQQGDGTEGHTGLVSWVSADGSSFKSVEGNTSDANERDGGMVKENTHLTNKPHSTNKLNILGFCYMPS